MNKIIVEVSIGELLDKISILEIKQGKIKDSEKLKFINNEHSILKDQLDKNVNRPIDRSDTIMKYGDIVYFKFNNEVRIQTAEGPINPVDWEIRNGSIRNPDPKTRRI